MSGHTPGPWAGAINGWIVAEGGADVCVYGGCGSYRAVWWNPADFRLAVAAPALFNALGHIAGSCEGRAAEIARAALAEIQP